jgi:hypothetical protein
MREITPLTPNPMSLIEIVSEYVELSPIEVGILEERFSSVSDRAELIEIISDMFPTLDRLSNDAWDDMRRDFIETI